MTATAPRVTVGSVNSDGVEVSSVGTAGAGSGYPRFDLPGPGNV